MEAKIIDDAGDVEGDDGLLASGPRSSASRPRERRRFTMREAMRRFQAYSRSTPSGERLPGVSMPWLCHRRRNRAPSARIIVIGLTPSVHFVHRWTEWTGWTVVDKVDK